MNATLDIGSGFLEEDDIANALAVFESVTQEILERFGSFHDESGELSELVARGRGWAGRMFASRANRGGAA